MSFLNYYILFSILFLIFKIIKNYYNLKRLGGEKIDTFKKSSKISFMPLLVITLFTLTLWVYTIRYSTKSNIISGIIFQTYLIVIMFGDLSRKIKVYENGIYQCAKFILWSEMESVRKDKYSIQVKLKNKFQGLVLNENSERKDELFKLIDEHIKKSKDIV